VIELDAAPEPEPDAGQDAAPPPLDARRPALLLSYDFSGPGPDVVDRSRNGHTGTLVGATLEGGVLHCDFGEYLDVGPFAVTEGYTVRFDVAFGRQDRGADLISDDDRPWIVLDGDLISLHGTSLSATWGPTVTQSSWHRIAISKSPGGGVLLRVDDRVAPLGSTSDLGPAPVDHLRLCPSRPGFPNQSWIELDNVVVFDEAFDEARLRAL